ncbi:MAG: GTP-binding protein [Deltaproteobacteria bacterium]|nr:MAG: GTP-binding protein [Deltaproteobacteria bacterium]
MDVREVAGGCICCSAGIFFEMSLVLLLGRKPDRLLIEPTGLATLSGILEVLRGPGFRKAVDLQPILVLVDAFRWSRRDPTAEEAEQMEAADIVLASHGDRAGAGTVKRLLDHARSLFPPKQLVGEVRNGEIPLELILPPPTRAEVPPADARSASVVSGAQPAGRTPVHRTGFGAHARGSGAAALPIVLAPEQTRPDPAELLTAEQPVIRHAHTSPHATTIGWRIHDQQVFDDDRIRAWMSTDPVVGCAIRRKAVVRTRSGWWSCNATEGQEEVRASAWRRDSRIELIWPPSEAPDPDALERTLLSCLLPADPV